MRGRISMAVLLGLCLAPPVRAEVNIGAGWADSIDGEGTEVGSLSWVGEQRHPWEVMAGYIGARERVPDASFLALSKRLTWRRWYVSGGVAWVSEDNEVLSGHGQFMTALGLRLGRVSVSVRHLSNADTNGRNRGETFLLAELGL